MEKALGAGKIAEGKIATSAVSMVAESAIPFGKAVKYGTDPENQVLPWDGANAGDKFAGVAVYSITGDIDTEEYRQYDPASVLKVGTVWVKVADNSSGVTAGESAAVTPDGFDAGGLTSGATGTYGVEIEGSEYLTSGSAGELVKLAINMPCKTTNVNLA